MAAYFEDICVCPLTCDITLRCVVLCCVALCWVGLGCVALHYITLHYITATVNRGPVHTTPEEFEKGALFLRLGLPSTLIRRNCPPKTELFENALENEGI